MKKIYHLPSRLRSMLTFFILMNSNGNNGFLDFAYVCIGQVLVW